MVAKNLWLAEMRERLQPWIVQVAIVTAASTGRKLKTRPYASAIAYVGDNGDNRAFQSMEKCKLCVHFYISGIILIKPLDINGIIICYV